MDKTKQLIPTMQTYTKLENENGVIELDLVFVREKGQSQQFLEISVSGVDPSSGQQYHGMRIVDNKEDFLALKEYFNQLKWE